MSKYYTSREHLLDLYDRVQREFSFQSDNISEYRLWRKELRSKLAGVIGLNEMNFSELKPEVLEIKEMDGFKRVKTLIQTEPGVFMTLYILIPDIVQEGDKRKAVIAVHGHGSGGKYAVAGRRDIPVIDQAIQKYNYDYGVQFVKKGYIVFCPDARGFGERREIIAQGEEPKDLLKGCCNELNNLAISMGQSLTGMWVWDLMRLVDYIENYEYVDSSKIAVCGFSGGGLQALWLSVMDERIKATIVANYFHGFKDTIFQSNMCGCNFVPDLWKYCDMGDLGAMVAPRPLMIKTGSEDNLNGSSGLDNVYSQIKITSKAYKLLNSEDNLFHHVFQGGHIWNSETIDSFLRGAL